MTNHLPGYMPYSEPPSPSELAPPAVGSPPIRRGFCGFWDTNERGICGYHLDEHAFLKGVGFICPRDEAA